VGRYRNYGLISRYNGDALNRELVLCSASLLADFFNANQYLLDKYKITIIRFKGELLAIYGIRITQQLLYEYKKGKRYTGGFLLISAIIHYWRVKGEVIQLG